MPATKNPIKSWNRKIRKHCKEAGTYKECYEDLIETLAEILTMKDQILEQWIAEGCEATVTHVNKAGAPNVSKNPLLMLWDDMNKTALSYWRDLGLSPSSLKKITGEAGNKKNTSPLAEALASLEK